MTDPACHAPTNSMYFHPSGDVRACCQNAASPLGNVGLQSLREIWASPAAERLRGALAIDDYSEGCGFCAWEVETGPPERVFARGFDGIGQGRPRPEWPRMMEFALTNTCNLQCVMCNGDLSSAIRARREHRPPLARVYGDAFFEQLEEFLPHLERAKFYGGEPLMGTEPLRVLDLLVRHNLRAAVDITTNGTHWTPRIERICEALPVSFQVSLDGITAETFEAIRVGASFDRVVANLDHFDRCAQRHGTAVSLAHCLMTSNWHELADLLVFAEGRGYDVGINVVLYPVGASLYQLSTDDLAVVVAGLEQQAQSTAQRLDRLRPVFDAQLSMLRSHLDAQAGRAVRVQVAHHTLRSETRSYDVTDALLRGLADWSGDQGPYAIRCDADDQIIGIDDDAAGLLGDETASLVGQPVMAVFARLRVTFGADVVSRRTDDGTGDDLGAVMESVFRDSGGQVAAIVRSALQPGPGGTGTVAYLAFRRPVAG